MVALLPSRRVFVQVGTWEITWYGVLYLASFGLAWWVLPRLARWRQLELTADARLLVVAWGAVGAVVGGRLGYALLYEPAYFFTHPGQIVALWDGGMASHGGFIGAAAAIALVSRRVKCDVLALADVVVVPAALGLALGRVGNFINQELYVSTVAHMLAVGKNLVIAVACYLHLRLTTPSPPSAGSPLLRKEGQDIGRARSGRTLALFLILYGGLRWLTEYGREPGVPSVLGMTYGQLLTLPVLGAGVWLMVWLKRSARAGA